MRNKIIALTLTLVMAVLALASCASPYNYAEEDLSAYATFDFAKFKEDLKKLEIEDADFTTDEAIRDKKVISSIYSTLASYAETNGDKKTEGALGANDVLYFAYYTTYEKDGKTYYFNSDNMKSTSFTSSTKAGHNVSLSIVDVDDEDADKFAVAVKKAIEALTDKTISAYKTVTSSVSIKKKDTENDNKIVPVYKSVYVSYTREHTVGEATTKEVAAYEKINLEDSENEIVKILMHEDTTAKIGSTISLKDNVKTFTITEGEITYTYSNFKILFAVEEEGAEFITFNYAPYTEEKKDKELTPDNLSVSGTKITVPKDAELTYHVFPVYYYEVSDFDATAVIIEALGTKLTVNSLDVFQGEEYKNGDKTIKALVEELVKINSDTSDDENLKNLKKAYDDAKAASDALSKDTNASATDKTAANDKTDAAKKAYDEAKEKAVAEKTELIVKAANTEGKTAEDVIIDQYKKDIYHSKKESYDSAIVTNLGKAIWKLITTSVKVNSYPDALIDEAVAHLTNEYEYKFYNETVDGKTTSESNYTAYEGDFDAYLAKQVGSAGIVAKAQEEVKPTIQLFVVAKAFEAEAQAAFKAQLEENVFLFDENTDVYYRYDEDNEKNKEFAYYCAENFVIDNEVLNKFKSIYGELVYDSWIEEYGEANLRTSIQSNNLFDYLLSAKLNKNEETTISTGADGSETKTTHIHGEYVYKDAAEEGGAKKLSFYNIDYVIKAEEEDSADK